ncbi:MAG: phosphoribosylaminoimidazolesuccinocarboxamide synthase [Bacteroidetes bacterium]|nr:phosphoribosylaminoimidazolesuccinocarboxamide synthase [Bacteroidota bacterium]
MNNKYDSYRKFITAAVNSCLTETSLPLPKKVRGKVRDSYTSGDQMVFVTTDRQSAFDRVLASIPFKGQVLNLTSAWWFEHTRHIIPNHMISIPDPNVTIGKKCEVFPIEFVVRGYITGTTDTSLWTQYNKGVRNYCGIDFPEGMQKNEKLTSNILTPTTKEESHDRPISPAEIVEEGWMTKEDWEAASKAALDLFAFGQQEAAKRGLILVDTKYEMGKDSDGTITLIDEIHTPDSSRYWLSETYKGRLAEGNEPENIDKEFLRLWFRENCDPYNDKVLPEAPIELVTELSLRYIRLYEMITGNKFSFPSLEELKITAAERLAANLQQVRFFQT